MRLDEALGHRNIDSALLVKYSWHESDGLELPHAVLKHIKYLVPAQLALFFLTTPCIVIELLHVEVEVGRRLVGYRRLLGEGLGGLEGR